MEADTSFLLLVGKGLLFLVLKTCSGSWSPSSWKAGQSLLYLTVEKLLVILRWLLLSVTL